MQLQDLLNKVIGNFTMFCSHHAKEVENPLCSFSKPNLPLRSTDYFVTTLIARACLVHGYT
jgi:hypothetical protein